MPPQSIAWNNMKTLVLGTANFGGSYGVTQKTDLSSEEIEDILLWSSGKISELDTSEDYRGSHNAISNHSQKFKITSKINLNKMLGIEELAGRLSRVNDELNQAKLERILLRPHFTDPVFTLRALEELAKLQISGLVSQIGLTIYDTQELEFFSENIDIPITFQVPMNLFNMDFQRLVAGSKKKFSKHKFYVRSIFLQGLLLMRPEEIPSHLKAAVEPLTTLNQELAKRKLSLLEATIALIKEQDWISGVVIGVASLEELKQNLKVLATDTKLDLSFLKILPDVPREISDPRRW
jgi:aryl-alcohol dehydrogenase-like predicted oxidoreductase